MSVKITICGDLCPTSDTEQLFDSGNKDALFNQCIPLFMESDLVMGNLEFPLMEGGEAVAKTGPILRGKTHYAKVFQEAGFHLLGMANNHIKDLGSQGVLSSIKTVKDYGMTHVGAGSSLSDAKKPFIQEVKGKKVGVMAFAEQEFNVASSTEAGANYLDVYYDFDAIRELKKKVDFLIILYHGGIEYHPYPSPDLQKRCRRMVEAGADLVTCQHSHCIGSFEEHKEGTILYGQGNTLFGYRANDVSWNRGLLLQVSLDDTGSKIDFIPITATHSGIDCLPSTEANLVLKEMDERSIEIDNPKFIEQEWLNFCNSKKSLYMALLLGFNRMLIHANRLSGNRLVKVLYSSQRFRAIQNLIRCESHNEVIQTLLKNKQ